MDDFFPLYSRSGNTATITLRRPQQHNRLDPQDLVVLSEHITVAQNDNSVQLLVLTGAGDKTFCSGYTIEAIAHDLDLRFENLLNQLENCTLPTLCAINGNVYGGGIDLALCCDFRLGLKTMQAFMPAARFGLHYHADGLRRFTQQLGLAVAKQMLLTGMTLEADALERCGLVQELCANPQELELKVAQFASALAQCEPSVVRSMKQQLNAIAAQDPKALTDRSAYVNSLQSPQLLARLAARSQRN